MITQNFDPFLNRESLEINERSNMLARADIKNTSVSMINNTEYEENSDIKLIWL